MELLIFVYLLQLFIILISILVSGRYSEIRNKVIDEVISSYPSPRQEYNGIWFDITLILIFSIPLIGLLIYNNYLKC